MFSATRLRSDDGSASSESIGQLIPAGTGMKQYRNIGLSTDYNDAMRRRMRAAKEEAKRRAEREEKNDAPKAETVVEEATVETTVEPTEE